MPSQGDCVVTFPIEGGIFGVGRLATRLHALKTSHQIGEWHIGRWVDWRHKAIRISFDTPEDATFAKSAQEATTTVTTSMHR